MRKVIFRAAITTVAMLGGIAFLAQWAWADSLTGLRFLQAQGPTSFLDASFRGCGWLSVTGLIDFDGNGGARSLHVTLFYAGGTCGRGGHSRCGVLHSVQPAYSC